MHKITKDVKFFLNLARIQGVMNRRFDSGLGGISLNEFVILYHLSQAHEGKLRGVDLADKTGLTASGVTRLLIPMEKIGLIKREQDSHDARASFVKLAPGGKRKFSEGLERAGTLAEDILSKVKAKKLPDFANALAELADSIR